MKFRKQILYVAFILPLGESNQWQSLEFNKIPANKVKFSKESLLVKVDKSASPLIYPLKKPQKVKGLKVKGKWKGQLNLKDKVQGEKGADDFILKLGFVTKGDRTLNAMQRWVAADWIKTLFSLAPEGTGVDKILFLNLVNNKSLLGKEREHPLSDLIYEKNLWLSQSPGNFELEHNFKSPQEVLALWISIDGDDTNSKFQTEIHELKLDFL